MIYEAGKHTEFDTVVPFFAMEYIPNAKSITEYAEDRSLSVRERLKLFCHVCDAVHHGHQRGIVHRDLKPGNILVDSSGHPKIIDFGVARATDSDMAVAAQQTEVGQLVGSLQYMSPEQFDADPNDIDTRSDVYALGVVLYQLMSGSLPYEVHGARVHELAALVRAAQPPSLKSLDAEVDTIVQCSLAKDRERRYQSAFGLSEDLRRYLDGAAISARRPTFFYQLRVLARRNKVWIGAGAAVLLALVAGGVLSFSMYLRAESARADAEIYAQRQHTAAEFITEMLDEAIPPGFGKEASVADLLVALRENVDIAFADEPEIAAEIHTLIGWGYLPREEFELFEEHCSAALALRRSSLGDDDPRTLESLRDVSRAQSIRGRVAEQLTTELEIIRTCEEQFGPDGIETLTAQSDLAIVYEELGRFGDARESMERVLKNSRRLFGEQDAFTIDCISGLANIHLKLNEIERGYELALDVCERARASFAEDSSTFKLARTHLAAAHIARGDLDQAAALYDERMPQDPGFDFTYQGVPDLLPEGPQILVMWETWCPYSQRALPIIENLYRRHHEEGLSVIGATRVTRTSSDERVRAFVRDQQVTFPVVHDSGKAWSYFEAKGTPYVILFADGRVVWKGSVDAPADLSDRLVRQIMEALPKS
jgi:non-specific serine/threonine protein kinase/serine/threonine-protein kinase